MHLLFPEYARAFSSCIPLIIVHYPNLLIPSVLIGRNRRHNHPLGIDLEMQFSADLNQIGYSEWQLPNLTCPEMFRHSEDS